MHPVRTFYVWILVEYDSPVVRVFEPVLIQLQLFLLELSLWQEHRPSRDLRALLKDILHQGMNRSTAE